ncbi:SAM-dependent methyltransferase [Nocardia grenadensis]|uniref:SAM-dependent methyltransferase n=1 Tax=Nocardia grenadensis TaxID=931537 RepID=UPI0027D811D8|nr:SAM-dependent methyltransferase [Nocardia grenadensis]
MPELHRYRRRCPIRPEIWALLDGLTLVEPGVVPIDRWRPDTPATNPGRRSPRTAPWTGHPGTATARLGADRDRLAEGAVPHRRWSGEPRQQGRCELICCLQMYLHL